MSFITNAFNTFGRGVCRALEGAAGAYEVVEPGFEKIDEVLHLIDVYQGALDDLNRIISTNGVRRNLSGRADMLNPVGSAINPYTNAVALYVAGAAVNFSVRVMNRLSPPSTPQETILWSIGRLEQVQKFVLRQAEKQPHWYPVLRQIEIALLGMSRRAAIILTDAVEITKIPKSIVADRRVGLSLDLVTRAHNLIMSDRKAPSKPSDSKPVEMLIVKPLAAGLNPLIKALTAPLIFKLFSFALNNMSESESMELAVDAVPVGASISGMLTKICLLGWVLYSLKCFYDSAARTADEPFNIEKNSAACWIRTNLEAMSSTEEEPALLLEGDAAAGPGLSLRRRREPVESQPQFNIFDVDADSSGIASAMSGDFDVDGDASGASGYESDGNPRVYNPEPEF